MGSLKYRSLSSVVTISSVIAGAAMLTACSPMPSTSTGAAGSSANCAELFDAAVSTIRSDESSPEADLIFENLSRSCRDEYEIATDYSGILANTQSFGVEPCTSWEQTAVRSEAIELLHADGMCTSEGIAPSAADPAWPEGGLGWDQATAFVGTHQRVCGPLMSARTTEDGVFVNVGADYPAANRFTFILWGDWWIDPIEPGAVICSSGSIYLYEGVTQMEIDSPQALEIWR